jgi:two-component system CheB/CheR fusion protein
MAVPKKKKRARPRITKQVVRATQATPPRPKSKTLRKTLPPKTVERAQDQVLVEDAGDSSLPLPQFPIVGIGASAGGLEALSQLLQPLPADCGVAVIVVQHLSPTQDSVLPSLLADNSQLPVAEVTNELVIERNHIYVVPPNAQLAVVDGSLRLTPRPGDRSQYKPVDFFLRSLAAAAQSQAIGVILSGTDSDGSVGLREIKAAGGITIAQDPKTAKFDGMPRAAIATGAVDLVLGPADIAKEIVRIARYPLAGQDAASGTVERVPSENNLQRIFSLLRSATGVDFTHYKLPTIRRRMQRRMVLHKLVEIDEYVKLLQHEPAEVRHLYQDILIHVTRFFRDPESFETLAAEVFPQIMAGRGAEQPVRIWVPGCSTGEEPYSIGICLLEFLGDLAGTIAVQIFATDVSESAVDQARLGIYPESIVADVSADRLRRFFSKTDGSWRVTKQVRDMCIFARQDLTRDPPFSKLDLIVCRNVLIYLGPPLQKKLMNVFHYALQPHGFLMLGSAETTGAAADLYSVIDKRHRLFMKKPSTTRADMNFRSLEPGGARQHQQGHLSGNSRGNSNVQNEANRLILARYSPSGVIVNDRLEIVQFRGQTGLFLEPAPGEATHSLFKMAREGLLYGLRTALHGARKSNKAVRKEGLRVKHNGSVHDINIEVLPLPAGDGVQHFLVLFQDVTAGADSHEHGPDERKKPAPTRRENDTRVTRLQEELAANREYLQSIIQDLEATNEELQSANEEILSANEELQSTNEELDTAKEELQSTNEELNTVNDELQARNEEMTRINSDLVNLLGSVQIAIVMVAGDLRIRRFTPMAEKVLNLIPSDIGRPISDIKPNIDCPDLEKLITEAVDSVNTLEREVRDRNGNWFALRIRPYKNVENRIDGAVLALFDIDTVRRKELEAREAMEYADAIIETLRQPLLVLDSDLRVRRGNRAFYQTFGVSHSQTQDRLLYELGDGQWNIPVLRTELENTLRNGRTFEGFRVEHDFARIGRRVMLLNGRVLQLGEGSNPKILLAIEDVTGREPA